jgi:saccharopine dehydrogenase-like NADP-dependent oxidoreductase
MAKQSISVLALGGTGDMGRYGVRALITLDEVASVTVAGLDTLEGRAFVRSLGDRAAFMPLDIEDHAALVSAMAKHDVVMNTAGPFFRLGEKVQTAAIAAGRSCIDICDDVQPTLAALERHDQAKAAGVTLVTGLGLSPGITNLLARMAAEQLDNVTSIDTVWDLAATATVNDGYEAARMAGAAPGAMVHWMHVCSGDVRHLEGGVWRVVRPVEPYPLPLGGGQTLTGWTVSHPETATLPLTYPGLTGSRNFMAGRESIFRTLQPIRDKIDAGELGYAQAAAALFGGDNLSVSMSLDNERAYRSRRTGASRPYLTAIAQGTKEGRHTRVVASINRLPPGGMGGNTGIPAAIGIQLWARGDLRTPGAFAPEAVVNPEQFFRFFEPFCDLGDTPLVSLSVKAIV